jgi:hypothetical protein
MGSSADGARVRAALQAFQDGYTARALGAVEDFMDLFVQDESLEVIGTGAIVPGLDEWCQGPDAARELVYSDWEGWGDVRLDVEDASINVLGDVAWLSTSGNVIDTISKNQNCLEYMNYIRETVAGGRMDNNEEKLFEIMRGIASTLAEVQQGETYIWPFRFTAVLVKRGLDWRFRQVHFSFPTTRFPDVRIPHVEQDDAESENDYY